MDQVITRSYAKVNLTLDVLGKRPEDGYHYIRTVMVPVNLSDRITIRRSNEISVRCNPDVVGPDHLNLAFRAAHLLKKVSGYRAGAEIQIDKEIPVAGGLAGGSTNAGTVLTALNTLWETGLTEEELVNLAIGLGSDVPFFVPCRPARVEGIGECLKHLHVQSAFWLVLATPSVTKSTGNVYRWLDEMDSVRHIETAAMEIALLSGDVVAAAKALGNVFEDVMLPRYPEINALKMEMLAAGALGAVMSGAGPTVFGLVSDESSGRQVLEAVRRVAPRAHLVRIVLPAK